MASAVLAQGTDAAGRARPLLLSAVAVAGVAAITVTTIVTLNSDHFADRGVQALMNDWIIFGYVFAGLIAWSLFSYYASASVALTISGAKQVTRDEEPELTRIVENLCIGSGLPMPKVYVIDDTAPNAFATGRDPKHASVAATRN